MDFYGPSPISWRRFAVLARGLPAESQFMLSLTGGAAATWEAEMATTAVEMSHAAIRVAMAAAGAKKHKIPKALSIDRPWEAELRGAYAQRRGSGEPKQSSTPDLMSALAATGGEVIKR